ncbi:MAG TPA: hypothetical protein VIZ61_06700 [Solirubrobacterales bacterium]
MLLAALACSPGALARGGAGHNDPTQKLEDAFKVALHQRTSPPTATASGRSRPF